MPVVSNIAIKIYNNNAFNLGVMRFKDNGIAPAIYYNTNQGLKTLPGGTDYFKYGRRGSLFLITGPKKMNLFFVNLDSVISYICTTEKLPRPAF